MNASSVPPPSPPPRGTPPPLAPLPRTPEAWADVARALAVWRATMAAEVALYGHVTSPTAEGASKAVAAVEAMVTIFAADASARRGECK